MRSTGSVPHITTTPQPADNPHAAQPREHDEPTRLPPVDERRALRLRLLRMIHENEMARRRHARHAK